MTTKNEMLKIIKLENPDGLRIGDEENGYTQLSDDEAEIVFNQWADARLAKEQAKSEAELARQVKISAYEKLGLTEAEIEALLPTPKPVVKPTASA
jgi:hypothetical protein